MTLVLLLILQKLKVYCSKMKYFNPIPAGGGAGPSHPLRFQNSFSIARKGKKISTKVQNRKIKKKFVHGASCGTYKSDFFVPN